MTIDRKRSIFQDISSDSTDSECDRRRISKSSYRRKSIKDSNDIIMIGDSDFSDSDIDVISENGVPNIRKVNGVWRNIIECDILDDGIKCIGLDSVLVRRDTESYELPISKLYDNKIKKTKQKHVKSRLGFRSMQRYQKFHSKSEGKRSQPRNIRNNNNSIICLSTSDDEVEIVEVEMKTNIIKKEPISVDSDVDSSSEDDQDDTKVNSWSKLMEHLYNNEFQVEFEDGRRRAASRIANELKETNLDLIDRCIIYLGLEKCMVFLEETKKIEELCGMPTKDGSRRRTPGGVFFTMIKADKSIDDIAKEQIFQNSEKQHEENDTLWWKSLETCQYKRNINFRGTSNFARKKEFKSYTFLDLDYFEGIRDFRYRYIPVMSTFPPGNVQGLSVEVSSDESSDDLLIISQEQTPAAMST